MLFEELYPNILTMLPEERIAFLCAYQESRKKDLESEVIKIKTTKKGSSKERKIPVTPEQLRLLREVGLV